MSDRPNILSWHPTRKLLMIGSLGGTVIVLDVVTKEKDFIEGVSTVKVFQAKFSPVGDEIALAYGDGHIRFWTSDQKRIIKDIKAGEGAIYQLSWHPAGKAIVSLSEDRNIQLWNIEHQQPGWTINIPYAQSIDWSPKGDLLATWFEKIWLLAKADGDIRIAFPKAGSEIYVTCLDWHIQGDLIAAGGSDSDIRIWQISSKKLLYRLKRHSGEDYDRRSVTAVAFNPVNHTIASAGQDANIYVWDSDNRKLLYEFIEHEAPIEKIAWHPEGRILASCGLDGLVCLWDTMTGHILQRIEAHSGGVVELSWSPEGKYLASGGYDKTVKVWQISEAGA